MPTKLEEQDEHYRNNGFNPDSGNDYHYPQLSKEEWHLFLNLQDVAKESKEDDKLLVLLSQCQTPYDIEKVYQRSKRDEFRQLVAKLQTNSPLLLPDSAIFDKIDLRLTLEDFIDWLIRDGGEIRQGAAYEEDGNTIKEEWVRLYWK